MALGPGTRLGVYEILSLLGSGGMGEVYRARDHKLDRDVAIKVLPDPVAGDPERLARFEREAKTLALLNHPNIAHIYGLEDSAGVSALVMELVEGPTLADRIVKGPIPLDEALPIAKQIAEGLEAAHELGIIHRDLKPANIKVCDDGTVKVLDFGLAKALEPKQPSGINVTQSPTITTPARMTGIGVILGTAAYMAPEQAKGQRADRRSDVWAFGCVLFEMLAGQRAFRGDDVSDTLAEILKGQPDWHLVPRSTPPAIDRLLRRCLDKNPRRRMQHMGDVAIELEETAGPLSDGNGGGIAPRSLRVERSAWAAALVVVSAAAGAVVMRSPRMPINPETRVDLVSPATTDPVSFAVSPDGRRIVFAGVSNGRSRLFLRSFEAVDARPLAGTDGATLPFWSPSGESVGFFADDGKLKRLDLEGGAVRSLASVSLPQGAAWNRSDVILYVPRTGPIFRVADGDRAPIPVTKIQPEHRSHSLPSFLPDGRHFLYFVSGAAEARGVYVGDLNSGESRRLFDSESAAVYSRSGHIFFIRRGGLYAQRFDADRLDVRGAPTLVADRIAHETLAGVQGWGFSVSDTGTIAYRTATVEPRRQFAWFDRSGRQMSTVGAPDDASPTSPSLSPDGQQLALHRNVNGNVDVWLLALTRGVLTRFTTDPANDIHPIWSPDGRRLVYGSNRRGTYDLYERSISGSGDEHMILSDVENVANAADWSTDGRFLLFQSRDLKTGSDIWVLPMTGDRKPRPFIRTEFDERDPQFSSDGKWVAYQSTDSGRPEIYVQPFPGPGARTQLSTNGGAQVRWRADMREVFYVALDERLMVVRIALHADTGRVDAEGPVALFTTHLGGALQPSSRQQYVASSDGQRFLINTVEGVEETSPITLILNWPGKP